MILQLELVFVCAAAPKNDAHQAEPTSKHDHVERSRHAVGHDVSDLAPFLAAWARLRRAVGCAENRDSSVTLKYWERIPTAPPTPRGPL